MITAPDLSGTILETVPRLVCAYTGNASSTQISNAITGAYKILDDSCRWQRLIIVLMGLPPDFETVTNADPRFRLSML